MANIHVALLQNCEEGQEALRPLGACEAGPGKVRATKHFRPLFNQNINIEMETDFNKY